MTTMALRPHAVIGEGERHLNRAFGRLASLPFIPVIGEGETWCISHRSKRRWQRI